MGRGVPERLPRKCHRLPPISSPICEASLGFIPKGFIRGQLKKNPPPVKFLLDWKGEVHKRYQTEKEKPTLYLISQEGTIVFHEKADFKPEIYAELKNRIGKLLAMNKNKGEGK